MVVPFHDQHQCLYSFSYRSRFYTSEAVALQSEDDSDNDSDNGQHDADGDSDMEKRTKISPEILEKLKRERDTIMMMNKKPKNKNKKKGRSIYSDLPERQIPRTVLAELQEGKFLKSLRRFSGMNLTGYEHYWRCLLWASEFAEREQLKTYDMKHATLLTTLPKEAQELKHPYIMAFPSYNDDSPSTSNESAAINNNNKSNNNNNNPQNSNLDKAQKGRYFLRVPGLAEDRPSVMVEDQVRITTDSGQVVRGTVQQVFCDHLQILLSVPQEVKDEFQQGQVHVRFLPSSRINFRLAHHGTTTAKHALPLQLLAPIQKHAQRTIRKIRQKLKLQQQQKQLPQKNADENDSCDLGADLDDTIQDQSDGHIEWFNLNLNREQREAVHHVVHGTSRPLPYIILGPPGTGKSATVTEAILQWLEHNNDDFSKRILVLAPSNDAADVLLTKLSQATRTDPYTNQQISALQPKLDLVRIISFRRAHQIPPELQPYVHATFAHHTDTVQKIRQARVTIATVNMATRFSSYGIEPKFFQTIVIDEAGHATEPEVISVVSTLLHMEDDEDEGTERGHLVLAGDPKQLGPVVLDNECKRLGLDRSFMERLSQYRIYKRRKKTGKYEPGLVTMLTRNYRSHEAIIQLCNDMFYDGDLTCHAALEKSHNLCDWEELPNTNNFPVLFHAVVDGESQREDTSPSWFNPQEVEQCVEYAKSLVHGPTCLTCDEIGIITPYTAQVMKIRQALKDVGLKDIKVGSVETFQGQERRAIIVSTVRSGTSDVKQDMRSNLGFVAHEKRFNVALTRPQALLIVVGCPEVLALDKKNWLPFLKYCIENDAWKGGAWKLPTK